MPASTELSNVEKVRKLPWALSGDAANVVYVYLAFAGPIYLLFLDKLGLDKKQIGVLLAIFPFCGLMAPITGSIAARVGFKRVFLGFWLTRKVVMAAMIASPWVLARYGPGTAFAFVAAVTGLFALCRAIAESAQTPWSQEYIPNTIRGKYTAVQTIVVMLVGAATVALAGRVLGRDPPLNRFILLFGVAFFFGLACVFFFSRVPGGAPAAPPGADAKAAGGPARSGLSLRVLLAPLADRRFRRFLVGGSLLTLGWTPMTSFLPLFMKEQVGLRADQVVFLDAVVMIGGLCTSFLWGWAADRYGGKPVMVLNLALLLLYPVGLLLLPRHNPAASNLATLGLVFVIGLVLPGWSIGYYRYLFVNLIPPERKTAYLGAHTAWVGLTSGGCPLLAGYVLDHTRSLGSGGSGSSGLGWIHIDPYTPFFISCLLFGSCAVWVMSRLPGGTGALPVARFAAMFVQGNPVAAVGALIGYQFAGLEEKRISTLERLGQTRSPLSIEELVAGLDDPSFNVRYEAVISIARTRPDPRLTEAIARVLKEAEPDLQTAAAWALGRMGDPAAGPVLREMLDSPHALVRSRVARALGMLRDPSAVSRLLTLFQAEGDPGIRVAYASALSALGKVDAVGELLDFLRGLEPPRLRREASLAVATLLGRDDQALRLWRRMHDRPGDTLGGVMLALRRRLTQPRVASPSPKTGLGTGPGLGPGALGESIDRCARAFGTDRLAEGAAELQRIGRGVRPEAFTPTARAVLHESLAALAASNGHPREEYVFLAVHAMHVGLLPENAQVGV